MSFEMPKSKIVLFSPDSACCPRHQSILASHYDVRTTRSEDEFTAALSGVRADAAVICLCSGGTQDTEKIRRLHALVGPIPTLICTQTPRLDFVRTAVQCGTQQILICSMHPEQIRYQIDRALRNSGLHEYVEVRWPGSRRQSPLISKFISEVIRSFPQRTDVQSLARRLGIDRGWLYKLCKAAFGLSVVAFMRHIWVHQALHLMQHTNLDNTEIALQLGYSEESSMAREFRKTLGCSPGEVRRRLTDHPVDELLR